MFIALMQMISFAHACDCIRFYTASVLQESYTRPFSHNKSKPVKGKHQKKQQSQFTSPWDHL